MTNEEIKQNAEWYSKAVSNPNFNWRDDDNIASVAYIAGAHSRDEEIESMGEQLKNAVSMLKDIYEDDDYFCARLLDIPEEEKICEIYCDKEGVQCDCILRYLKHYKKGE